MSYIYTEAIVLDKKTIWEADRLYIMFTPEYGKIEAQVKSAASSSSKLAGSLEPVSLVETMIINGKHRETIGGVQLLKRYQFEDWATLSEVSLVRELFCRLVKPGVKELNLYLKLKAYLEAMNTVLPANVKAFYTLRFTWQLLKTLGYAAEENGLARSVGAAQTLLQKCSAELKQILAACIADKPVINKTYSAGELMELKKITLYSLKYFLESDLKSIHF